MFCKHCGKQVSAESTFCSGCGGSVDDTKSQNTSIDNSPKPSGWLCCPKCRSKKLQATVESTVTGTGGGYSVGKGCLGSIFLGPLGLLCGSGGKKQNIETTHQTMWLCHDCGNKFINPQEQMNSAKALAIILPITIIIVLIFFNMILNSARVRASDIRTFNMILIIIFIIAEILIVYGYIKAKSTYESMKNENT